MEEETMSKLLWFGIGAAAGYVVKSMIDSSSAGNKAATAPATTVTTTTTTPVASTPTTASAPATSPTGAQVTIQLPASAQSVIDSLRQAAANARPGQQIQLTPQQAQALQGLTTAQIQALINNPSTAQTAQVSLNPAPASGIRY